MSPHILTATNHHRVGGTTDPQTLLLTTISSLTVERFLANLNIVELEQLAGQQNPRSCPDEDIANDRRQTDRRTHAHSGQKRQTRFPAT